MKYINLLATLLICFCFTFLHAQSTLSKTIYFDHDKHVLTADSKSLLQSFATDLNTYTDYSLEVIGHTDQDGTEEYNLLLSQNRAETVLGYLASEGLSPEEMSVSYFGESIPLQSSYSTSAKSQNRRVTIRAEVYNYSNIKEMVSQILPENLQQHTVSQLKETKITLSQGTEVTIPAGAFCHLDGSPINVDQVQLTCKEVYTYAGMLDERLFTQTTDHMLETGGMIYMEASLDGEELRLQEGKNIELKLPEQGVVKGMEVFEGLEDSTGTIWSETGTKAAVTKEEPFVQIDLSPLFDFVFEDTSNVNLTMVEMPDFPRPLRIAYPPNKKAYSEEEYKKVYKKYKDVMEAHHKDKEDLYERQQQWHAEAKRRTELLYNHKAKYIRSKVVAELKKSISGMPAVQETISHHKLIAVLKSILDSRVEKIKYDERLYKSEVFIGAMADVRELRNVIFPDYQYTKGYQLLPEFNRVVGALSSEINSLIRIQRDTITRQKYEVGYIDQAVVGNYVLEASSLGWINCDRFINRAEYEMTELELAKLTKNQNYYLVFKNIKSMLRPIYGNGTDNFLNVPKGEEVRLISLNFQDGKAQVAYKDFVLGSEEPIDFNYRAAGVKELRKVFDEI